MSRLEDADRVALEDAARETTERQWSVLASRLAENFTRMRQNGVAIDEKPPADVMAALHAAADATIADWLARVGPDASALLQEFRARRAR